MLVEKDRRPGRKLAEVFVQLQLAAELKVGVDDRCWPVAVSFKKEDLRCTMCDRPTEQGHQQRKRGMHAPIKLPNGWQKRYQHKREGFALPAASGAEAPSAEVAPKKE